MVIGNIVKEQRIFFKTHTTKDLEWRLIQLKKLKKLIKNYEARILDALEIDLTKPRYDAFITEIVPLYEEIDIFSKNLLKWAKVETIKSPIHLLPSHGKLYKDPYGVIAVFAPWNYPVQLLLSPAIGAIATGNCAILKPSDLTMETQKVLIELINDNFDHSYLYVLPGGIPECNELLKEKLNFIFFTGSARVGKIIMSAAAKNLTPVCLELGGKSPCILDKSSNNIDLAVKKIVWAKFINAGQTCVAPDYVYVHKSIKSTFLQKVKSEISRVYSDNVNKCPKLASIITDEHFNRLINLIQGHDDVWGGNYNQQTKKIMPTIFDNVTWSSKIMDEEIFGPIMPILEYDNIDEVISKINLRAEPLSLYLFSDDKKIQNKILTETTSGGGCVNDCILHVGNPRLPFGGVGNSGMGAYHGKKSFDLLTHTKGIHVSSSRFDSNLRFNSKVSIKTKLIKFFFK